MRARCQRLASFSVVLDRGVSNTNLLAPIHSAKDRKSVEHALPAYSMIQLKGKILIASMPEMMRKHTFAEVPRVSVQQSCPSSQLRA